MSDNCLCAFVLLCVCLPQIAHWGTDEVFWIELNWKYTWSKCALQFLLRWVNAYWYPALMATDGWCSRNIHQFGRSHLSGPSLYNIVLSLRTTSFLGLFSSVFFCLNLTWFVSNNLVQGVLRADATAQVEGQWYIFAVLGRRYGSFDLKLNLKLMPERYL